MSLIIGLGSNLGDSHFSLLRARTILKTHFQIIAESRIYLSKAQDYEAQPDFLNQVLEFKIPENYTPEDVMKKLLFIEENMGRKRDIKYGPRNIDLDLLFWDFLERNSKDLILPHPRWMERSFVVKPLSELPFYSRLEKKFQVPKKFVIDATPL